MTVDIVDLEQPESPVQNQGPLGPREGSILFFKGWILIIQRLEGNGVFFNKPRYFLYLCIYIYIFIEVICEDCMLKCSPSRGLDCWDPL